MGLVPVPRLMWYRREFPTKERWHVWAMWNRDSAQGHRRLFLQPLPEATSSLFLYDSGSHRKLEPLVSAT